MVGGSTRIPLVRQKVQQLFGRVPHKGEKKVTDGVRVAVEKVERTRVLEVLVTLPDLTSQSEAA